MTDIQLVELTVNGERHELAIPPRRTLADVLRHDLGLTGTHVGCEHGICGACTVLVDDAPARACLLFAVQVENAAIRTVESLSGPDGGLSDLQQCFGEHHGLQCGFCTPGFIVSVTAFLRDHPSPTDQESREALSGNLCRCTGYQGILAAVRQAAGQAGTLTS